jgi:hypothetical protein
VGKLLANRPDGCIESIQNLRVVAVAESVAFKGDGDPGEVDRLPGYRHTAG